MFQEWNGELTERERDDKEGAGVQEGHGCGRDGGAGGRRGRGNGGSGGQ